MIVLWPMRTWIAFGWAPDAIASATLVWRRSWNRHFTPAAASAFFQAWLWKLECEHRRFNFVGDTTWLTGEVVDKVQTERPTGVRSEVHLQIRCTNQRGVVTTPGKAIVLVPSREHGPVELPKPPVDSTDEMLAYEIERLKPGAS